MSSVNLNVHLFLNTDIFKHIMQFQNHFIHIKMHSTIGGAQGISMCTHVASKTHHHLWQMLANKSSREIMADHCATHTMRVKMSARARGLIFMTMNLRLMSLPSVVGRSRSCRGALFGTKLAAELPLGIYKHIAEYACDERFQLMYLAQLRCHTLKQLEFVISMMCDGHASHDTKHHPTRCSRMHAHGIPLCPFQIYHCAHTRRDIFGAGAGKKKAVAQHLVFSFLSAKIHNLSLMEQRALIAHLTTYHDLFQEKAIQKRKTAFSMYRRVQLERSKFYSGDELVGCIVHLKPRTGTTMTPWNKHGSAGFHAATTTRQIRLSLGLWACQSAMFIIIRKISQTKFECMKVDGSESFMRMTCINSNDASSLQKSHFNPILDETPDGMLRNYALTLHVIPYADGYYFTYSIRTISGKNVYNRRKCSIMIRGRNHNHDISGLRDDVRMYRSNEWGDVLRARERRCRSA